MHSKTKVQLQEELSRLQQQVVMSDRDKESLKLENSRLKAEIDGYRRSLHNRNFIGVESKRPTQVAVFAAVICLILVGGWYVSRHVPTTTDHPFAADQQESHNRIDVKSIPASIVEEQAAQQPDLETVRQVAFARLTSDINKAAVKYYAAVGTKFTKIHNEKLVRLFKDLRKLATSQEEVNTVNAWGVYLTNLTGTQFT